MGEHTNEEWKGVHLVITNSVSPFAVGKYTGPLIDIFKSKYKLITKFKNKQADDALSTNVIVE